jgi:heat-inducible transcriptional repressor
VTHHDPIGLIAPHAGLAQLNERSRDIFRQIVESYLATGEPVGSRNISRLIALPLSPASVRNVMSDLEQLGLIYAPHTSAGRLPTELGLRFFVDSLMQVGDLYPGRAAGRSRRSFAVGQCEQSHRRGGSSGEALPGALRADARRRRGARRQRVDMRASSTYRVRAASSPPEGLVVLVGEDGSGRESRLIARSGHAALGPRRGGNYLNARIRGRTLAEARSERRDGAIDARRAPSSTSLTQQPRRGRASPRWADASSRPPPRR